MTGKNSDDVYLLELRTGKEWKVSHHNEPSRDTGKPAWRIAMTSETASDLGSERSVVDHWEPEEPQDGWHEGVGVLIPFSHLRQEADDLPGIVVQVLVRHPASLDGYSVRLFLEEPGAVAMEFPPGVPIAVIERFGGGKVYVLAVPIALGAQQYELFEEQCAQARAGRSASENYPTERFVGVSKAHHQRLLVDLTVA